VAPQPKVLLVESQNGAADHLREALQPAGVQADVRAARRLPTQLSELDAYEGIVLIDVPAGDMTLDQMATLREFVRSEGRGLVATGGRSSFTLGAYKGTPLEEALPVAMDPPPRPERPPVTLLLILDHSLSMGSALGVSKFDMAKESALLATESLHKEDRLGVLAFDDKQDWAVEFQTLGSGLSLGQIQERIGALELGGGTDICAALDMGLSELERQPGQVRHAVLMTDGQSFLNGRCGPYNVLIDRARANLTATGQRHLGATKARHERAEHQDAGAHLAHQIIGRFGQYFAPARVHAHVGNADGHFTTQEAQQSGRGLDVPEPGHIAQQTLAIREQRRA